MTAGYSVVATADAKRRFPRSSAKVNAAEDFLVSERRHFACRHVLGGAAPVLCTDHPALGLLCTACMRSQHLPRHSEDQEHTCDECGEVVARLRPIFCSSLLTGIRIREPRGRSARCSGLVHFIAVGCCSACWRPA